MRFGGLRRRAGRWAGGGLTALVLALAAAGAPFGVEAEADVEAVFDERAEPRWAEASEIDRFLRAQFEELRLPGLAVLVVTRDGVRFEGMYGNADPAGRPVSADTPFLLGSTSKQFTALAVHQLVVQGRLGLENTVGALVPELAGTDSAFAAVTVEQLLGHTSGLSLNAGHDIWSLWPQADSIRDEFAELNSIDMIPPHLVAWKAHQAVRIAARAMVIVAISSIRSDAPKRRSDSSLV